MSHSLSWIDDNKLKSLYERLGIKDDSLTTSSNPPPSRTEEQDYRPMESDVFNAPFRSSGVAASWSKPVGGAKSVEGDVGLARDFSMRLPVQKENQPSVALQANAPQRGSQQLDSMSFIEGADLTAQLEGFLDWTCRLLLTDSACLFDVEGLPLISRNFEQSLVVTLCSILQSGRKVILPSTAQTFYYQNTNSFTCEEFMIRLANGKLLSVHWLETSLGLFGLGVVADEILDVNDADGLREILLSLFENATGAR